MNCWRPQSADAPRWLPIVTLDWLDPYDYETAYHTPSSEVKGRYRVHGSEFDFARDLRREMWQDVLGQQTKSLDII
jgi:hypothetical protein